MRRIAAILLDPARKRAHNKQLFAVVAPRYNQATRLLSFGRDTAWKRELLRCLPAGTEGTLLDIATGNADLAILVRKRCANATVVACDLSADMLNLAIGPCREIDIGLARQDMSALALKDNSVNAVTAGYALRNAPDLERTLAEIHRVLKPSGTALILEFSRSPAPLLSALQCWLLGVWGGTWGLILHGRPSVYAYLAHSLAVYPERTALHTMIARTGFAVQSSRRRMAGFIELLVISKADGRPPST